VTFGIELPAVLQSLGVVVQIFIIDLLLSADNALLIAMAVRTLPPGQMQRATMLGTVGAIGLRLAMAAVVLFLLDLPYLKVVAATLLLFIALRLTLGRKDPAAFDTGVGASARLPWGDAGLLGAIGAIMAADAVMSLDNVLAIATVADGSLMLLALGLALSIPMLVYGSAVIRRFLVDNGALVLVAGMALGWIAGGIGISDPAVAPWIESSAPALGLAVPIACAVFVLWESRILGRPATAARPGTERA